jgi:4-hydroxyacetophenone monooxygenase
LFEGEATYEGKIFHPSQWPEDWKAIGRRVAVIGNGSTGVQLLAPIAEEAEQVFVFQRTAQWISPRPKYGQPVEAEVRWLFDNFPGYWNWARFTAVAAGELQAYLIPDPEWIQQGGRFSQANDKMRDDLLAYIRTQINGRQDLFERLIPDVPPFARRFVVDNRWYKALTRDNVELVTDPIARFTSTGIESACGVVREVDTIVTATGFDVVRYLLPARFTGRGGVDLHEDLWSVDGPRAYLGMMVPQFPNMFMLYGPNSQPTSGAGGLHHWWVLWSSYAARCIMRLLEGRRRRVEVRLEAYTRYNKALDTEASRLLYVRPEGDPDKNYYVNNFGRLQVNSPWRGVEFNRLCTIIDWGDIDLS